MTSIRYELLQKIGAGEIGRQSFGDISLDSQSSKLIGQTTSVALSKSEYLMLWLLIRAQGAFISKDEIAYTLYEEFNDNPESDIPITNTIEVFIARARRKISTVSQVEQIELLHGLGYIISKCPANAEKHTNPKQRRASKEWTFDEIAALALQEGSRHKLFKFDSRAYFFAQKKGWLDEIVFPSKRFRWTSETLEEEAKKYSSKRAFKINSSGAYQTAKRRGLLDKLFPEQTITQ